MDHKSGEEKGGDDAVEPAARSTSVLHANAADVLGDSATSTTSGADHQEHATPESVESPAIHGIESTGGASTSDLTESLRAAERATHGAFIVYMGVWAYAALALVGVRDEAFYAVTGSVTLPVFGLEASPGLFVLLAPLVVIIFWAYMQLLAEHSHRVRRRLIWSLRDRGGDYDWSVVPPWLATIGYESSRDRRDQELGPAIQIAQFANVIVLWASSPLLVTLYALRMYRIRGHGPLQPPYLWFVAIVALSAAFAFWWSYRRSDLNRNTYLQRQHQWSPKARIVIGLALAASVVALTFVPDQVCRGNWLSARRTPGADSLLGALMHDRQKKSEMGYKVRDLFCRAQLSGANLSRRNEAGTGQVMGADLSEVDLRGAYLVGAYLENATLSGARLEGADLRWANLAGAKLNGTHLEEAYMTDANFAGVMVSMAHFEDSILDEVHFEGALIVSSQFHGATLMGAHFEGASLQDVHFEYAVLGGDELDPNIAEHWDTHFEGASLIGSSFVGARMLGTYLNGATLIESRFDGALMLGVHWQGTDIVSIGAAGPSSPISPRVPAAVVRDHRANRASLPSEHEQLPILTEATARRLNGMSGAVMQIGDPIGTFLCSETFGIGGLVRSKSSVPCLRTKIEQLELAQRKLPFGGANMDRELQLSRVLLGRHESQDNSSQMAPQ